MSSLGNKDIMSANILRFMKRKKASRKDVCDAIGVKYTTFCDWINAKTYPRIDRIEQMANYFGVTKADLVEDVHDMRRKYSKILDHGRRIDISEVQKLTSLIDSILYDLPLEDIRLACSIIECFRWLSAEGRKEATKRVQELAELAQYTTD